MAEIKGTRQRDDGLYQSTEEKVPVFVGDRVGVYVRGAVVWGRVRSIAAKTMKVALLVDEQGREGPTIKRRFSQVVKPAAPKEESGGENNS